MPSLHGFTPTPRPASELREYLESTRSSYVERFVRRVAKMAAGDAPIAIEQLIEVPNDAEPDQLFRLMRADVLSIDNETATVEVIEGPYEIEDVIFDFAGVPVTVHDLAWENVLISVHGPDPSIDAIAAWGALWIDINDRRAPDDRGVRRVIHRFTRPAASSDGWTIHVDFGTADADAFIDLLEIASADASAIDVWIPGG